MNKPRMWTIILGVGFILTSLAVLRFGLGQQREDADLFWLTMLLVGILFITVELANILIQYLNNLHNKL